MDPLALMLLAGLGLAAGVAIVSIVGEDEDEAGAPDPELLTGSPRDDVLSGMNGGPATRIEGGAGDDVLTGDDGDVLSGGDGADLFEFVVGDPNDDPVVIEDLDYTLDSLQEEPDRILLIQEDGQVVSYRGVLDGGLEAIDRADGSGADIYFEGRVVATVESYRAADLNVHSSWVANFSPSVVGRLEGDDVLVGDAYANPDDVFEAGAGDDVLIGGAGSDLLDGGAGNDQIDGTDPDAPSEDFDLILGGAGDDVMRGDDGDLLIDGRRDGADLVVDTEGSDRFEVVIQDDATADPVFIFGDTSGDGIQLGQTLLFYHADGTALSDSEMATITTTDLPEFGAQEYAYQGRAVAYVFDARTILAEYGDLGSETIDPDPTDPGSTDPDPSDPDPVDPVVDGDASALDLAALTRSTDALRAVSVAVTGAQVTGLHVSDALFGANAVYKVNTDQGDPLQSFTAAVEELGNDHIRFPAGQGDGLYAADDGVEWLNVVKMETGADGDSILRPELTAFLDWARDPDDDGATSDAKEVTLVLPTKYLEVDAYHDFAPEIQAFAVTVMEEYGDVIHAFEIGNEYWEMGETAYASKANIAISALLDAFDTLQLEAADQPDIIVQMATPNAGSEFHTSVDDRSYQVRVEAANQQIIDTLTDQSKGAIDGVVEHYYYNQSAEIFGATNAEVNNINTDYAVWSANIDKDLDLYLTEWNVKTSNIAQNGLKYTGTFSEQLEYAVRLGADTAHIWAVQHNTTTDLAGASGDPPLLDAQDRLVNTIRGATYELMRDTLPGLENLHVDVSGGDDTVEINGYYAEDKVVLYVASRVAGETHLDLDLSDILPQFESASAVRVSMDLDPASSDGVHFVPNEGKVQADYVIVGGQRFYFGEHDARAVMTDYTVDTNTPSFQLKPFEMVEMTFHLAPGTETGIVLDPGLEIFGTPGADDLTGTQGRDVIYADAGNDKLTGGKGNDVLYGEAGQDRLYGWGGDDVLEGGDGADTLAGNQGDDQLRGQRGSDQLNGAEGNDKLNGGTGHDVLRGGAGADAVSGHTGNDIFAFEAGDIAAGDMIEDFTLGDDVIQFDLAGVRSVDDLSFQTDAATGYVYITAGSHGTFLVKGSFTLRQLQNASNFLFL